MRMNTHHKFQQYSPGKHLVRSIPFKAHKINRSTPEMLEAHYEDVYGGAVRRLNEIEKLIATNPGDAELREQHLAIAYAISLHEVHFGSIAEHGGKKLADPVLQKAIIASFGSITNWQSEFSLIAAQGTGGWVVLAWSERLGRLMNMRTTENTRALSEVQSILAINLDQVIYAVDFGSNRNAYVATFIENLHWERIADRFHQKLGEDREPQEDVHQISVAELKERLDVAFQLYTGTV